MNKQHNISAQGIKELEKMANEGAIRASTSLSKLILKDVKIRELAVRSLPLDKITKIIGKPEMEIISVAMEVHGDVKGDAVLVYPQQSAINLADFLSKRELGSTTELDELDISAIKESGNIIFGAFLSAISDYLSINMVESVPQLVTGMLKSSIEKVVKKFSEKDKSNTVAFEIDFIMGTDTSEFKDDTIKVYFILLLDVESTEKLLTSLKKISGGKSMTT
jgi:chemotaxis protein CheC